MHLLRLTDMQLVQQSYPMDVRMHVLTHSHARTQRNSRHRLARGRVLLSVRRMVVHVHVSAACDCLHAMCMWSNGVDGGVIHTDQPAGARCVARRCCAADTCRRVLCRAAMCVAGCRFSTPRQARG
eukprot:m.1231004 g.1231004  ORF g.1231004 m.1231004 type:complete len:126 (+) comp24657_c0_seq6:130-507(+)